MTLWDLPAKHIAQIASVSNTLDTKVVDRLSDMGLVCGQSVTCVRKGPIGGSIVLQLGGSVFAIDRTLAAHIHVDATEQTHSTVALSSL